MYAGCQIIWYYNLQTQIDLSTTKAKYTELSHSSRDCIPICYFYRKLRIRVLELFQIHQRYIVNSSKITTVPWNWNVHQNYF